jgi:cytochrome c-type biogenesis protein CcmH/NrfG
LRKKGYALTELGRLDDAEVAYRDSLRSQPGNPVAENELAYIAHLKSGSQKPSQGSMLTVQPDKPPLTPVSPPK